MQTQYVTAKGERISFHGLGAEYKAQREREELVLAEALIGAAIQHEGLSPATIETLQRAKDALGIAKAARSA